MAKHYDKFTLDAESIVSDTEVVKTEVSDTAVSKKTSVAKPENKKSGVNVVYKDGKVISSKPF